ncbi:MAG: ROK family protein [Opitutales bacterium]|nr:ROK family protein [Opitutales bacterium]
MKALGIDVGGTGIKAAPVDLSNGEFDAERLRIPTPSLCTPEVLAKTAKEFVGHFNWSESIGVGFPGVIKQGKVLTAANLDDSWIGVAIDDLLREATGCEIHSLNDADAAGLAEFHLGEGQAHQGMVLLLTIGTGIGSALFYQGKLVPNTELGHLPMNGTIAEKYTSRKVKKDLDLTWSEWVPRLQEYLAIIERIITPDLIIIGGGASKKFEKFSADINLQTPVVPARHQHHAGIIGAAFAASNSIL